LIRIMGVMSPHTKGVWIATVCLLISTCDVSAIERYRIVPGTVKLSLDGDYASGKYGGDSKIEDYALTFKAKYDTERFAFKVSVPYVWLRSKENVVIVDSGIIVPIPGQREQRTESGLGDVSTKVTYHVPEWSSAAPSLDISGKVKFGTGDEDKGLGSGEKRYYLDADLSKEFAKFTPFAGAGYKWREKSSDSDLKNTAYGWIGLAYALTDQTELDIEYDHEQAVASDVDPYRAVSLTFYQDFDGPFEYFISAYAGFGDSSPDWGSTLGVSVRY
jgi:hypothetical protein